MNFRDLKAALILCAAFADLIESAPVPDTERSRVQFFARWSKLPEGIQAACVLAALIKSPLCQDTPEVQAWRHIRERQSQIDAVRERVN